MIQNENGITIKQLKEYINSLPETDEDTGEDYEVWIENTDVWGLSNVCKVVCKLNKGDIILSIK